MLNFFLCSVSAPPRSFLASISEKNVLFLSHLSDLFITYYNKLKKPFILLRKKNKLPADTYSVDFELEYGTATIEMHKDSIEKTDSVLIIDDLIATGGTADAAAKLIKMSGVLVRSVQVADLLSLWLMRAHLLVTQNSLPNSAT